MSIEIILRVLLLMVFFVSFCSVYIDTSIYHGHITKTLKVLTAHWLVSWDESDTFTTVQQQQYTRYTRYTAKSSTKREEVREMKCEQDEGRYNNWGRDNKYTGRKIEELCKLNYVRTFCNDPIENDPRQWHKQKYNNNKCYFTLLKSFRPKY